MKNFFLSTLLIFLLGNLCRFGLPWWGIVPIAFTVAFVFPQSGFGAFLAGFFAGAMLWGVHALLLNAANGGAFAEKIGQLFQGLSASQLLYATALMGGLLAAFGALTGQCFKDLMGKQPKKDYYQRRKRSGRYW